MAPLQHIAKRSQRRVDGPAAPTACEDRANFGRDRRRLFGDSSRPCFPGESRHSGGSRRRAWVDGKRSHRTFHQPDLGLELTAHRLGRGRDMRRGLRLEVGCDRRHGRAGWRCGRRCGRWPCGDDRLWRLSRRWRGRTGGRCRRNRRGTGRQRRRRGERWPRRPRRSERWERRRGSRRRRRRHPARLRQRRHRRSGDRCHRDDDVQRRQRPDPTGRVGL